MSERAGKSEVDARLVKARIRVVIRLPELCFVVGLLSSTFPEAAKYRIPRRHSNTYSTTPSRYFRGLPVIQLELAWPNSPSVTPQPPRVCRYSAE